MRYKWLEIPFIFCDLAKPPVIKTFFCSVQSGAVYLSLDFVILFCLSCEGLPGQ